VLTLFLLRLIVRPFRLVVLATISVVVTYGWLVGGEPSVRRAVTAASVYLALTLFGLAPNALNVLAVVALVLAAADPGLVLDAGAWLSFGATLGIILGASRFTRWATSGAPERPPHTRGAAGATRRIWLALLALFSATVAAELVLLPVSAALFFRAGLLGLVLNFVAIPAMTVVQIVGLALVGLAGWWPAGADACGWLASVAATWLVDSSLAVDAAPWMVWRVPPSPPVWILAFYVSLSAALWLPGRRRWRQLAGVSAAGLLLVIVTSPELGLAGPDGGRLRVTLLDVGQGEAIAVQFPDGHSMLVDAGGQPGAFDVGERVVTPALWALGVRRLDWLAVTHADADHAGGALEVVRNFQPREIWEGVPVPGHSAALALREEAHRRRSGWREVRLGQGLELGGAFVEALHPPRPDWERRRVRNEDSLVLRIVFGQVEILLTGDAGAEFERGYDPSEPRAQLRVLKVGHHGSRTSSSAAFVEAVSPHIALVSAGHGNIFGHPAPDVLSRFEQRGTVVFRTDRDGAIIMETDGAAVDVRTWSGRRWSIRAMQN
jgi:competence protein ComEC